MPSLENKKKQVRSSKRYFLELGVVFIAAAVFIFSSAFPQVLNSQVRDSTMVARTISVADEEVSYGDVILYDNESNLYRLSFSANDPRFFGVVVEEPTLIIETDGDLVPVLQAGVIPVNVTLENGEFLPGSPVTTSSYAGKAMRATDGERNIFGFAIEGLSEEQFTVDADSDVPMGTILVEVGGERLVSYIAALERKSLEQVRETESKTETETESTDEGVVEVGVDNTIRLGFAALVALGSIFLIYFAFASSIKHGVVSVGRNPRAKSSIQSMVVLNVILAIVVTAAAIFFAISLLVTGN